MKKGLIARLNVKTKKEWLEEYKKCKEDAYYFYTTYFKINGESPVIRMTREEFNSEIKKYEKL